MMERAMISVMRSLTSSRTQELAVYAVLAWAVLFRGGKSLEATWFLAGLGGFITLAWYTDARMHKHQTEHMAPRKLWLIAIGIALWSLASFILSSTRNYGLDEVLRMMSLSLIFLWVCRHRYRDDVARRLTLMMGVLAVAASVVGAGVYILQPVSRFVGTFFDARFHTDYWPNAWAQFILIAWPLIVAAACQAQSRMVRVLWHIGLGIVCGALFLSYSRGAMIAFGGQAVLFVMLLAANPHLKKIRTATLSSFCVILVAVTVFAGINAARGAFHEVQSVGEKITFTADEGTSSVDERRQFWWQAAILGLARPVFGWGPYSFRFTQPSLQTGILATSDHPHNLFLKLFAEQGAPAMLLLMALLIVILAPHARIFLARDSAPDPRRIVNGALVIAVFGALAHNMIDYNLQFVGIALPFFLILGLLASPIVFHPERGAEAPRIAEVTIAVCLLVLAFSEGRYLVLSSLGRHAQAAGNGKRALYWYERSAHEIFSRDMLLSRAQLLIELGGKDEARDVLMDYISVNAEDARGWKMLGALQFAESDFASAKLSYQEAVDRGGMNDMGMTLGLLRAAVAETGSGGVMPYRERIDELLAAFTSAMETNTHFVALSQNVEDLLAVAGIMASVFPEDAPTYEMMAAKADFAARRERAQVKARAPGYLW